MRAVDDGYYVAWLVNLCTSADASFRVGPFATRGEAEGFIARIPDGEIDPDYPPPQVVTHLWDYSPTEVLHEWEVMAREGSAE